MTGISTHVLDLAAGRPAAGIAVTLSRDGAVIGRGVTDRDGRCADLLGAAPAEGRYRLSFDVAAYLAGADAFWDVIPIDFVVAGGRDHYHVPLLLSPFGYSTYRGS